jgi:hypothetical protein
MENIVAGHISCLEELEGVVDIKMIKKAPCLALDLTDWETKNHTQIPNDFKAFYTISNGFEFSWSTSLLSKPTQLGKINILRLEDLKQTRFENYPDDVLKVFIIEETKYGKICLCYLSKTAQIWFHSDQVWHFISDSFSGYFRLSFATLGIFGWQMGYTIQGLPAWTMNWMHFYCREIALVIQKHHAERTLPNAKQYNHPLKERIRYQPERVLQLLKNYQK